MPTIQPTAQHVTKVDDRPALLLVWDRPDPATRERPEGGDGMNELRAYTPEEVAQLTGFSRAVIYRAIRDGELAASRLRGRLKVRRDAIDAWFDENRVEPEGMADPNVANLRRRTKQPPEGSLRELQRRIDVEQSA